MFVSLFVPFAYFNHSDGWNQGARLAELHAIVLKGTVSIDAYHEITGDKALIDGHYYSEKAPVIVLMALPAFSLTVLDAEADGNRSRQPRGLACVSSGWRPRRRWACLRRSAASAFFALLAPRLGVPIALVATYAVFLGSLTFPYATAMFAHAGTIGLLCIALWAALGHTAARHDYIAGLFAGLAVASEYPAIIPVRGAGTLFRTRRFTARLAVWPGTHAGCDPDSCQQLPGWRITLPGELRFEPGVPGDQLRQCVWVQSA